MAKRGLTRDYRIEYRYEKTRIGYDYDRDEPIYNDKPIIGVTVHGTAWTALRDADEMRRRGATATVIHIDPVTKVRTVVTVPAAELES